MLSLPRFLRAVAIAVATCSAPCLAASPGAAPPSAVVREAWTSVPVEGEELDSLAAWQPAAGRPWLIASAKEGQRLVLFDADTVIVTTVHDIQVLDEDLPETDHDFRVDLVVTPREVIRTGARRSPGRIDWSELDDDQIAAIPALAAFRPRG